MVVVSAQVSRDQRRALEKVAAREDRTLSAVVRRALSEYVESLPDEQEEER
jgi:predicted transcriptional regulator